MDLSKIHAVYENTRLAQASLSQVPLREVDDEGFWVQTLLCLRGQYKVTHKRRVYSPWTLLFCFCYCCWWWRSSPPPSSLKYRYSLPYNEQGILWSGHLWAEPLGGVSGQFQGRPQILQACAFQRALEKGFQHCILPIELQIASFCNRIWKVLDSVWTQKWREELCSRPSRRPLSVWCSCLCPCRTVTGWQSLLLLDSGHSHQHAPWALSHSVLIRLSESPSCVWLPRFVHSQTFVFL